MCCLPPPSPAPPHTKETNDNNNDVYFAQSLFSAGVFADVFFFAVVLPIAPLAVSKAPTIPSNAAADASGARYTKTLISKTCFEV
jgi:hypothetical protein